jgi:hypothetical protein
MNEISRSRFYLALNRVPFKINYLDLLGEVNVLHHKINQIYFVLLFKCLTVINCIVGSKNYPSTEVGVEQ